MSSEIEKGNQENIKENEVNFVDKVDNLKILKRNLSNKVLGI